MPQWLISILIPFVVGLLKSYAVPALEAKWPALIPIVNEILNLVGQGSTSNAVAPSAELKAAGDHFNNLCSTAGCPTKPVGLG